MVMEEIIMKKMFLFNSILSLIFLLVGFYFLENSKLTVMISLGLLLLVVLPILWSMACFKIIQSKKLTQRIISVSTSALFLLTCNVILAFLIHCQGNESNYTFIPYASIILFSSNEIFLFVTEQIEKAKFAGRIKVGILLFFLFANGIISWLRPEISAARYPIAYSLYLVATFIVLPVFLGNVALIKTKLKNVFDYFFSLFISWVICAINPLCRLIQYYCGSFVVDREGVGVLQLLIVAPAVIICVFLLADVVLCGVLFFFKKKTGGVTF